MHMELKDLPPRMRKEALKILAMDNRTEAAAVKNLSRMKKSQSLSGDHFDSRGEYEYYMGEVVPRIESGEILSCERQPEFELFPAGKFGGLKLHAIRYTADFRLEYADGTVEIVEVKSKFVRRMQRDYHIRRRLFIEQYARPNGWKFTEIITDERKEK